MAFPTTQNYPLLDAKGYALWDTFEVSFFFFFGIAVGLSLGFLIPSIWRTFRRRFRNVQKYVPQFETEQKKLLNSPLREYLQSEKLDSGSTGVTFDSSIASKIKSKSEGMAGVKAIRFSNREVDREFVSAQNSFLSENFMDAVASLLKILKSKNVTKNQTNMALYALASAYYKVGLISLAYDIGLDFLSRKPKSSLGLNLVLKISEKETLLAQPEKIATALKIFQGSPEFVQRQKIASLLCKTGKTLLDSKPPEALEWGKKARQWWPECGEAALLLWMANIGIVKKKMGGLNEAYAEAFLQERAEISRDFGISTFANQECENELKAILGQEKVSVPDHKCKNCSSLFEAFSFFCANCGSCETLLPRENYLPLKPSSTSLASS